MPDEAAIVPGLEEFFTSSLDLFAVFQADGIIGHANPAWTTILGWDAGELHSTRVGDLVHPDDAHRTAVETEHIVNGKSATRRGFEHRLRCADGSFRWIEWTSLRWGDQIYSTGRDITRRHAVIRQLDENLQKIEAVFAAAADSIIVVDRDMVIAETSPVGLPILDFPNSGQVGQNVLNIVHPDDRPTVLAALQRTFDVDEISTARYRAQHFDGRWLTFEGRGRAMRNPDGSSDLAVIINRDVTKSVAEEAALAESHARIKAIVDTAADTISIVDRDLRNIESSEALESTLGVPPADRRGRSILERIHPDDHAAVIEGARKIFEEGETVTLRVRLLHADGRWLTAESRARATYNAKGAPTSAVVITRDITASVAAEVALTESLETTRAIFDAAADGIIVLDRDLCIVETSSNGEGVHGRPAEERRGQRLMLEVVHPDDRENVEATLRRTFDEEGVVSMRYRVRRLDGEWMTLESRGRSLRAHDGPPSKAVFIARDVTDSVAAQAALESAKVEAERATFEADLARAEAERANAAKSDFLSRMSHELRTPLNSVLGFSQILQMEPHSATDEEIIDIIYRSGSHLLDLINEVLDISRVESGTMSVALDSVSLCSLVEESLGLVLPQARERDITVTSVVDEDLHVRADHLRLRQVLLNLLSNAIKFNRLGGRVTIGAERSDGRVRLSVADDGPGIAVGYLDRLFVPFERLDAEARGIEGTGLGLALSKSLIELMGGSLVVESHQDVGSTFTLELAQATPTGEGVAPSDPSMGRRPIGAHQSTLLYIEDNTSNTRLVERLARHRPNVSLITSLQGSLGLELARQHRPGLILLDVHLPDVSGLEVLRRLRSEPTTATIPVVMLSADASSSHVRKCLDAGANDYLTKPIDVVRLLNVIDDFLGAVGEETDDRVASDHGRRRPDRPTRRDA